MSIEITRTARSYAAYLDGLRVGELIYARRDNEIVALHTVVEEAAEGKGVGGALARALLDDVREGGLKVVAQCPFVAGFLDRHPEYADLRAG
ncbi:GNAT family N-acetyltransferase [Jiangella alkaliphila]|uniref:N-acetyltransferase domain-containing protein n=1 Tax=Jiangella alkaliphila TaxID=419479 RepID=A0A1H2HVC5_9ACTN|nr:GNAT family N-acetyltransferase [Jiangella alkaliphila]SDU35754.1 hypothetical protein SAMN04488563_1269 [Jiangella alkaliphila]